MSLAFGAIGVFCAIAALFRFGEWLVDGERYDRDLAGFLAFASAVAFGVAALGAAS